MYGLCMPTGEVYLVFNDGTKSTIAITDLLNPRKEILADKWIRSIIKKRGYNNIKEIVYERDGRKTIVPMADYYAEHGQELEG